MLQTHIDQTWLEVDSLHIHCLAAGQSGSPVILLHGGGMDSASISWGAEIAPLSAHHRVLAPDLPGYGESDKPAVEYTLDYYAHFLSHLLDALHLDKASLVGLSLGGGIALSFTLNYPTRVDKLVLVDTYGIQDKVAWHRSSYLFIHIPYLQELSYRLLGSSRSMLRWGLLAGGIVHDPRHLSRELIDEVYRQAHTPQRGMAFTSTQKNDMTWHGLRSDMTGRLHEITVPTLLIHGAQDRAVPLSYAQKAHALIKNSELVILQDCGHWAQREKPEEFHQVVSTFLDK
jgi:pimeloyl-ACP methyl ester carboxylesterase